MKDFKVNFDRVDMSDIVDSERLYAVGKNLFGVNNSLEEIAKDIVKRQDNAMAMEFTETIGKLLLEKGVKPETVENKYTIQKEDSIENVYNVAITGLDFTEHDKPFKEKIEKLEAILNHKLGDWDKMGLSCYQIVEMQTENTYLNAKVLELQNQIKQIEKIVKENN